MDVSKSLGAGQLNFEVVWVFSSLHSVLLVGFDGCGAFNERFNFENLMMPNQIGIVAPSSKVPRVELQLGLERIQKAGFKVRVHPQVLKTHLFFAGTDEERANAFFEFAQDPQIFALWCARGGHGALRLLPRLEKLTQQKGIPPRKILLGYSDVTALMEYVRREWGWATLHAPMPSWRKFSLLEQADWQALENWVQGLPASLPWGNRKFEFWTPPPKRTISAPLVGGNLTLLACLLGTRFQAPLEDSFLFIEEVDEGLYRIDRLVQQLVLSGSLDRIRGIILGNFLNCKDYSPLVLKEVPRGKKRSQTLNAPQVEDLQPLRKTLAAEATLKKIFVELGTVLKVPVLAGLPVGHGPDVSPLPLGATYSLSPQGEFSLKNWEWLRRT